MKFKRIVTIIVALFVIGTSAAYAAENEPAEGEIPGNGFETIIENTEPGGEGQVTPDEETSGEEQTLQDTETSDEDQTTPDAGTSGEDQTNPDAGTSGEDQSTPDAGTAGEDQTTPDAGTPGEDQTTPDAGTPGEDQTNPDAGTSGNTGANTADAETGTPEEAAAGSGKKDAEANPGPGKESGTSPVPATEGLQTEESAQITITDWTSGQSTSLDGNSALQESGSSPSSTTNAQLDSVSFEIVQNQDYANCDEVNCSIRFTFTDPNTKTSYEGFLTGLQIKSTTEAKALARAQAVINAITNDPAGTEAKYVEAKAQSIADSYLSGLHWKLTPEPESGIIEDLIDAEKYENASDQTGSTNPIGDSRMCWAASASNVLTYTGWSENAGNLKTKSEDATFSQFMNAFFDAGSHSLYGIKWYIDGVNVVQNRVDGNGDAVLPEYFVYETGASMERATNQEPDKLKISSSDYSANLIGASYAAGSGNTADTIADNLITSMANGDGVAMNYSYEWHGARDSGHAVTVFGYIKETNKSGIDALKAIFLADSDSDLPTEELAPEAKASDTLSARESRVNKYELLYTERATSLAGYDSIRMYKSYESKKTEDEHELRQIFDNIVCVKSPETLKKEGVPMESEGTKDSRTTPDIVPYKVLVSSTAYTGDVVSVDLMFANLSYKAAHAANGQLVLKYSLMVYDENDNFLYKIEKQGATDVINAMNFATFRTNICMDTEGTYGLGLQLDDVGYYDTDGAWIKLQEAYTTNNTWTYGLMKITVRSYAPDNGSAEIPTFCSNYLLSSGRPLTVNFSMDSGLGEFQNLVDSNGNVIEKDSYSISENGDGTFNITFSAEFLKRLSVGQHRLTLQLERGTIYFIIAIV